MLDKIITEHVEKDLLQASRTHAVRSYFTSTAKASLWMKREDEIGGGMGGSKIRKYASLLSAIKKQQPQTVVIEGGLNSNNVLGLSSLLKSLSIPFKIACPESNAPSMGNALWTQHITESEEHLLVQTTSGHQKAHYQKLLEQENIMVVKEGAAQMESIPGLLTLAHEIVRFEQEQGIKLDRIYIDAGTGISAMGLQVGLQLLGRKQILLVVTQIAGNIESFKLLQGQIFQDFNSQFQTSLDPEEVPVEFLRPVTSKSFGSFNQSLLAEWRVMMRQLGMPIDLIYTAKHFMRINKHLEEQPGTGHFLIINAASQTASRNHTEKLLLTHPKKA